MSDIRMSEIQKNAILLNPCESLQISDIIQKLLKPKQFSPGFDPIKNISSSENFFVESQKKFETSKFFL